MKLKHLFSMTLLLLFGGTVMAKKVTADLSQGVPRGGECDVDTGRWQFCLQVFMERK